jgi:hypothetical protein
MSARSAGVLEADGFAQYRAGALEVGELGRDRGDGEAFRRGGAPVCR